MTQLAIVPEQGDDPTQSGRQISYQGTLRRLVRGKNISETTLLATDYLNHFNEIIMMLELVPTMPDCFDDAKTWQPASYSEHFRTSCFTDKDLAILAYDNAPDLYRIPFDETVDEMNRQVLDGLNLIEVLIESENLGELGLAVGELCGGLRDLVDRASAIIHGKIDGIAAEIPAEAAPAGAAPAGTEGEAPTETVDQAAIDALFDD